MHLKTLGSREHNGDKHWAVEFHDQFLPEFRALSALVRKELAARLELLREQGPLLGRPYVDTLKGALHPNMKELRFEADDGVWRIAFAFDPKRRAILLVGGNKSGMAKDRFYKELIKIADRRFAEHLKEIEGSSQERG